MAAHGARAAAGTNAAHRRANGPHGQRSGITTSPRGLCAGSAATGLDGWPKYLGRLGGGDADALRKYAGELVALAPDVILAHSSGSLAPLLQASRTVPIVFTIVPDP